jgi:hypothetical protein
MITTATTSPTLVSGNITVSEMGVSQKRIQKILGYMRDNVYSDKILAVVREYACNAIDEHGKFKIQRPVEIGLRDNGRETEYFARDYANGLSDKDVREIFAMSGESTKDESNEDIGGFGIGAKCALSYHTKTFFVHSHFNGVKTTYCFALGANSEGQECGSVYDMGQCSTDESGLEVVVPVKNSDIRDFSEKLRKFVKLSPHNVVADILGYRYEPIKPSFETKLGKYNVRVLDVSNHGFDPQNIYFQMGGNTYKKENFTASNGGKIKNQHIIIVDIPNGDCSVTLSRESFEETQKNKDVFAEIDNLLEEYVLADAIQFKDKKVIDLVGDSLAGLKKFESDAFSYMIGDIYSDCWEFVNSIRLQGTGAQMMQNGKPVCIVIPENGIRAHWVDKVAEHLRKENLSAYVAGKTRYKSGDVDAAFHVICARKVKYAKVARDGKRYAVKTGGRSFGTFSPLEFFNAVSDRMKWGFAAANEKEAADFIATKKANVQTRHDLDYLRISQSAGTYKQWSAQSSKMINAVVALGFVEDGGKEDRAIRDRLHKEEQEKERKQNLVRKAKKAWVVISPRLQQAYQKEKNAERAFKFWSAVMKEGSLRGKILAAYEDSYSKPKLERHELRRILKLV